MSALRRLFPFLRPEMATLSLAYAFMLILGMTSAFYAFLSGPALKFVFSGDFHDVLRTSTGELRSLWQWIPPSWISQVESLPSNSAVFVVPALIVVTALLKGLAQTAQFFLVGRISQRVLWKVRNEAFAALLRQSPSFFTKRAHGDLLSRLSSDTTVVEQTLFYGVAPLVREPLSVIFLLAFCFVTSPKLALFTFIIVPVAVLPLARFSKWLKRVSRRGQGISGEINAVAYEALAGVRVVQAFANEAHEETRMRTAASRYYRQMLKSYFIRAVRTPTMEFLGAIALGCLLGLLGYQVQTQGADPAQYMSFFVAIVMMYDPLKRLGNVSDHLAMGSAATERIFEVVDLAPEIQDKPGALALKPFSQAITLERVRFAYEDATVLENIDLTIKKGAVVALVGASGSGKTTIANLLPRFYDVSQGRLAIDGVDIKDVTLASLRAQVSVVSQDTFLFNTTVRDNIAYGSPNATPEQVRAAARAAFAEEFVDKLPKGYDTIIGERGITLSGGQRQRLAIARAFLRDAPILILDEATSSLDIESERFVQEALETLMKSRTTLVIAHRLSTVRRADQIAVLKHGHIVERGEHSELIALQGEYARLYGLQFQDLPTARAD